MGADCRQPSLINKTLFDPHKSQFGRGLETENRMMDASGHAAIRESLEFVPSTDWLKSPLSPTLPLPSSLPPSTEYGNCRAQWIFASYLLYDVGSQKPSSLLWYFSGFTLPSMPTTLVRGLMG